jgi:hypothetical protein
MPPVNVSYPYDDVEKLIVLAPSVLDIDKGFAQFKLKVSPSQRFRRNWSVGAKVVE